MEAKLPVLVVVSFIGDIFSKTILYLVSIIEHLRSRHKRFDSNCIDDIPDMPEAVSDNLLLQHQLLVIRQYLPLAPSAANLMLLHAIMRKSVFTMKYIMRTADRFPVQLKCTVIRMHMVEFSFSKILFLFGHKNVCHHAWQHSSRHDDLASVIMTSNTDTAVSDLFYRDVLEYFRFLWRNFSHCMEHEIMMR